MFSYNCHLLNPFYMKHKISLWVVAMWCLACPTISAQQRLAFPGAEGFGKYTSGGRGGKVYIVTNLNDHGPGSLREAVEAEGPRIVVFEVDGTIHLESGLSISNDDITIAGQSAPGDGICLADYPLSINASNVIVRYIRCRLGDKITRDSDGLGGGRYGQKNVILDHLSVSWSIDECLSIYKTENLSVQWCLVSSSLSHSRHTKGSHGFGGIWGGYNASFHHNLLANHSSRNPRFSSVEGTKNVDYRNNVVYNWGYKAAYGGGREGNINFVYNYYIPGPATTNPRQFLSVSDDGTSRYFVKGNVVEGQPDITADNRLGVGGKNPDVAVISNEWPYEPIKMHPMDKLVDAVLEDVGCSFSRDSFDKSVIKQARTRTAIWGKNGIVDTPDDCGGYPVLKHKKPKTDRDRNGIPDRWEKKHGSDIEEYLNSLVSI